MFRNLANLGHAEQAAGLGFFPRANQDSMPGKTRFEGIAFEPSEMRFGKEGETAFGDEVDAAGRNSVLDHVQIVVEADSKIGIVPGNQRPFEPGQKKPEIIAERLEVHGLVGHRGVDTKGASIRAAHAAEHGTILRRRLPGG